MAGGAPSPGGPGGWAKAAAVRRRRPPGVQPGGPIVRDPRSLAAVPLAEERAEDGGEVEYAVQMGLGGFFVLDQAPYLAAVYLAGHPDVPRETKVALLRDIIPDPLPAVTVEPDWMMSAVVALAESIYADRAFDRLPVLADALDDAGCTDPDVIGHLRGPGPHARGCWVVDLVLGKS